MVFSPECRRQACDVGRERLDSASVEIAGSRLAANDVQRGALLGGRFRQQQRPGREIERREPDPRGDLCSPRAPAKTARDHQVKHEVQIGFEVEDDPFAQSPDAAEALALHSAKRWIERANQERAGHARVVQRLSEQTTAEVRDVNFDVGELRHRLSVSPPRAPVSASTAQKAVESRSPPRGGRLGRFRQHAQNGYGQVVGRAARVRLVDQRSAGGNGLCSHDAVP